MDTILEIKCRPVFKEEHYSCSLKPFSQIFSDIPASESSFFRLLKTEFSSNPSSRLMYTDFGLISNHVLLLKAFFLLLESITEIKCKPVFFFSIFSVPNSFFRLLKIDFLLNAIHSDELEWIFCLMFFYSEQISCQWKPFNQVKVKPFFIQSNLSPNIGNRFLRVFLYIFLPVKAVFRRSENVFF